MNKSYNRNESKGEMGDGVLGVLILHRRSEKNHVTLFRLFFFKYRRAVLSLSLYRVLLACLAFPFCGLGFSFSSGPLVFLSIWAFRSDQWCQPFCCVSCSKIFGRVCCMGTALSLYPFLSRYSSMAYFLFSFSVFSTTFFSVLSDRGLSPDERVFSTIFLSFPPSLSPKFLALRKSNVFVLGFLVF